MSEWAEALAHGDGVFSEQFGVPVEAGWSGFPEALPLLLDAARRDRPRAWGSHIFFDDYADLWIMPIRTGSSRSIRVNGPRLSA